ncbi:hypothetical protein, partial [Flavobacterium sp. ACAM 123]|uniref:hypothetical protein n=1 Tax=Flavobacterium sp. ACAM 123 TaxID=1189620 RepID=UPI001E386511
GFFLFLYFISSYSWHTLQAICCQTLFLGAGRSFLWSLFHHQKKVGFHRHRLYAAVRAIRFVE